MTTTRKGRVVYNRKPHRWTAWDAHRVLLTLLVDYTEKNQTPSPRDLVAFERMADDAIALLEWYAPQVVVPVEMVGWDAREALLQSIDAGLQYINAAAALLAAVPVAGPALAVVVRALGMVYKLIGG